MRNNNSDSIGCLGIIFVIIFMCGLPWTLIPLVIIGIIAWLCELVFGKKDISIKQEKQNKNNNADKEKKIILDNTIKPEKIIEKVKPIPIELPQLAIDITESVLIEDNTSYADAIANCSELNFSWVRQYAANHIYGVSTPLRDRGESPLKNNDELNQYIYSYGYMHFAKMKYAINRLSWKLSKMDLDIVDWGCGQGIATMALLEVLRPKSITVALIEPSMLSLKRACLNAKYFHKTFSFGEYKCKTINKSFDELVDSDILTTESTKIHLFSNVLDIVSGYSQEKLIDSIKRTQKGLNYFICVSPYRDVLRVQRIDQFVDAFRMCDNFQFLCSVNTSKDDEFWECNKHFRGIYCENDCNLCMNKWTKVVRVFSVNL